MYESSLGPVSFRFKSGLVSFRFKSDDSIGDFMALARTGSTSVIFTRCPHLFDWQEVQKAVENVANLKLN